MQQRLFKYDLDVFGLIVKLTLKRAATRDAAPLKKWNLLFVFLSEQYQSSHVTSLNGN